MAYDLPDGGKIRLSYSTSFGRRLAVAVQVLLWLLVIVATSRFRSWRRWLVRRRHSVGAPSDPLIRMDDPIGGPT
jgi:uncharacterized protein (DUF58 family)